VRISIGPFQSVGPPDTIFTVRPLYEGIDGEPAFYDCSQLPSGAPMGGVPGGTTSSGVTWPHGSLILNPTRPIPTDTDSFGVLKSRY